MTTSFFVSYILLWIVVAVQFVAIFALYHHFGQLYLTSRDGRSHQGPEVGTSLKPLSMQRLDDSPLSLPDLGSAVLIIFMTRTCEVCDRLRPELERFVRSYPDIAPLVVCDGDREVVRQHWLATLDSGVQVVPDPGSRIAKQYEVGLVPFMIGVGSDGTVRAKGLASEPSAWEWAARELGYVPSIQHIEKIRKEVAL